MRLLSIISGLCLVGLLGCATPKYLPPPTYTLYAPPTVLVALPPEPKTVVDKKAEKEKATKKELAKEQAKQKEKAKEPLKKNDLPEVLPLPKPQPEKAEPLPLPRPVEPRRPGANIDIDTPIKGEFKLPKLAPSRPLPRIDLGASGPMTLPPSSDSGEIVPRIEVEPLQLPPASDPR